MVIMEILISVLFVVVNIIIVGVIFFEVYIKKKGEYEICCFKCKYFCYSYCIVDRGFKC